MKATQKIFTQALFLLLSALILSSCGGGGADPAPVPPSKPQNGENATQEKYKAGELIVKYKSGVSGLVKTKGHKILGSKMVKGFSRLRMELVKLEKGLTVEEAITKYHRDPNVEYAEPNYVIHTSATLPDDALLNELWGLYNTGQGGGTPGADIRAADAWDLATGDGNLVVAVIDTGIDYNHPDITGNLWVNSHEIAGNGADDDGNGYADDIYGIDTYNQDSDPMDDHGHGTHVSGTIGAVGNNGIGVAGVNWNVKVLNCKFLGSGGSGHTDGAIECLDYIKGLKERGENIVATSNSWGCTGCYSQALIDAIDSQRESGILFIAAAGNARSDNDDTANPNYPSSYELPNVIAVAATDHDDSKASFSSYGRQSVDIGAPGVDIVSLRAAGTDMSGNGRNFIPAGDPNAKYFKASGTSMATPHVAGLAALIQSQDLTRGWSSIRNLILSGGDDTPSMNAVTVTGKRINAYGSLNCTNSPVVSALQYPKIPENYTVGVSTTLSALSINCELPVGLVTVTTSGGSTINLSDDGGNPDDVANDGIFTGIWTPTDPADTLTFSSPAGTDTVNAPGYADLIMTAASGSAAAETGQTFRMPNTVSNQGERLAKLFKIGLYLSPDASITADDTLIGSRSIATLAPGGVEDTHTYTKATIPAGVASGTYYLGAIADYQNEVNEIVAEDNNTFTANAITISEVYADIAVTAVSGPANAAPGQQISVGYTVKNQGNGRAWQTFSVGFYLSTDDTITTDDIYFGAGGLFSSMFAGSEFIRTDIPVTVPASVAEGVYYLGVIADRLGFVVNEIDPTNNALAGNQINITNQSPDLTPTSLSANINVDQLTITAEVQNQGQLSAGATTLGIYLSSDASITADDYLIGTESIGSLQAGASTSLTTTKTVLHTVPNGTYYAGVIADYDNTLFEADDANNSLAGNQITIDLPSVPELPDLIISNFTVPATTTQWSHINVTFSVTNQGPVNAGYTRVRYYISSDAAWSIDDTELENGYGVYGLMAAATMTRNDSLWIRKPPGNYYVIAVADADGDVNEGNEDNNMFAPRPLVVQ